MQRTSKSPRKVALEALEVARQTLAAYSHRFSPRKFTQHQLFAILVLKTHQRKDYRGVIALMQDMPELVKDLGLESIPHFTTIQKASERLLEHALVQQLLDKTVEQFQKKALARSNSPRSTRRAWTAAAPAGTTSNAAKTARKSKNW
jgi:hypothetical protein